MNNHNFFVYWILCIPFKFVSSNCDFTIPGPVLYFTGKRWAFSCLFIVREWTIPFVFFSHLKKLISFILKKFVQFISISFIFSVKSFVQYKNKRLLEKFVRSEKNNRCTCSKSYRFFISPTNDKSCSFVHSRNILFVLKHFVRSQKRCQPLSKGGRISMSHAPTSEDICEPFIFILRVEGGDAMRVKIWKIILKLEKFGISIFLD